MVSLTVQRLTLAAIPGTFRHATASVWAVSSSPSASSAPPLLEPPPSETPISTALVRSLLAQQYPDGAAEEIAGPFEGFDMAVFRLGEERAVRLPRHRTASAGLEREIRWMPALGREWTFPMQRVLHVGDAAHGFPWRWTVTSWLPGDLAADRPLAASAAPTLGAALGQIHRPAPRHAPFDAEQSIRLVEREPVLRHVCPRLPVLAAECGLGVDAAALEGIWEEGITAPGPAESVWIHADLHPFNVISRDGDFGGLIDWTDVAGGDPAVDLGFLWLHFGPDAIQAAHRAYGGVDAPMAARSRVIGMVKAATLAVVPKKEVSTIGWRALRSLGVAHSLRR